MRREESRLGSSVLSAQRRILGHGDFPRDWRRWFRRYGRGQETSAYRVEELQRAAVHFGTYVLVSPEFFTCEDWGGLTASVQAECAQASLIRFAQRAWRRPLRAGERDRLVGALQTAWREGDPEEAVVLVAAGILQSPQFVFRVEVGEGPPDAEGNVTLSDWEVASRLSFLIWDSMPDAALFAAAASGELSEPAEIRAQTKRMLADPKAARALVRFHEQWLDVDGLLSIAPAQRAYGPRYGLDPMPEPGRDWRRGLAHGHGSHPSLHGGGVRPLCS